MQIMYRLREDMAMTTEPTKATFENTYQRYPFAPLVELALVLASRIKAAKSPVSLRGADSVFDSTGKWIAPE